MHELDAFGADQPGQGADIAPDADRVLAGQRQRDVAPACRVHCGLETAARAGDQRQAAGAGDGVDHLDRAALDPAAAERRHHLQDHGAGREGHRRGYTMCSVMV